MTDRIVTVFGGTGFLGRRVVRHLGRLPSPPITLNQVELMQVDNVASFEMPSLKDLGVQPHAIEEILKDPAFRGQAR